MRFANARKAASSYVSGLSPNSPWMAPGNTEKTGWSRSTSVQQITCVLSEYLSRFSSQSGEKALSLLISTT